jgi:hypothetical protein
MSVRSLLHRLVLILLLSGCYTVEEPPCPPIEIPENTGECNTFCNCETDDFLGTPFRLTRLEIDEPEELATLLNAIWSTDILYNTVNVLLVVKEFKAGTAAAFDSITFDVGPGWRYPHAPFAIPPEEGQPSQSVIETYCPLEGLTREMEVKPYHGHQCVFKSTEPTALFFHTGPKDAPIVCAPDLDPANAIPIKYMKVRFGFDETCQGLSDGYLEGCIAMDEADRICMCMATGKCPREPVDMGDYPDDDLVSYCKDKCGMKWVSFGQSVRAFGLEPTCITLDGQPGYRVQGFIDAEAIPDYFDPIPSINCVNE